MSVAFDGMRAAIKAIPARPRDRIRGGGAKNAVRESAIVSRATIDFRFGVGSGPSFVAVHTAMYRQQLPPPQRALHYQL